MALSLLFFWRNSIFRICFFVQVSLLHFSKFKIIVGMLVYYLVVADVLRDLDNVT